MHARELVELAAVAAVHGPALIAGNGRLSDSGLEQYWVASKCRLDRWGRTIKGLSQPQAAWPWGTSAPRQGQIEAVIEEVLASEVLTRVWTALLAGYDRTRRRQDSEYFGKGIYLGHLEARNRVLKLLITGPGISAEQAVRLNRLRQRVERWSDLLVGCLVGVCDVADYAPHPDRAREFSADLGGAGGMAMSPTHWKMTIASLRMAFLTTFESDAANPDSNSRIAASILRTFESDLFDSTGLFPSLYVTRLEHLGRDAEMLISDLFQPVDPWSIADLDRPASTKEPMPGKRRFG